jgi:hypothetical protein
MIRRVVLRVVGSIVVIVLAVIVPATLTPSPVSASGGINWVNTNNNPNGQFDCVNFTFLATGTPGGYAAVRIWVGQAGGTALVDSYTAGYPSSYTPINSAGTANWTTVSFSPQPAGTTLVARVYRALQAAPGSWDGQGYVDTTVQCVSGFHNIGIQFNGAGGLCSSVSIGGEAAFTSGYAALRIWLAQARTTTALVDSYTSGYPALYMPMDGSTGNAVGMYSGFISFAAQPMGTQLHVRLYRALSPVPGSWDSGSTYDTYVSCSYIVPTPTP